jgi:hypothetical protein
MGGGRRARARSMAIATVSRYNGDTWTLTLSMEEAPVTKTLVRSGTTVQEHPTGAAVQTEVVVPSLAALVGGHRQ